MSIQLPDFSTAKVLVIGDLMLDRYWQGETSRISPEAPVPVVHIQDQSERPGGAGNVALNIAALGAQARLISALGDDATGQLLEKQLRSAHVITDCQRLMGVSTITKLRVMSRHQQLIRLDFEEAFDGIDRHQLLLAMQQQLQAVHVVILSDYGKGMLSAPQPLISVAREQGVPVFVDPKSTDFELYRGAALVTPNWKEFEAVVGHCADEDTMITRGRNLMQQHGIGALLVTRGAQGMTLLEGTQTEVHLSAYAHDVYDVTGAGDTVISLMAASVAAGKSLREAMIIANIGAGIVVTKWGAATVSPSELASALNNRPKISQGCVSEEQLLVAVAQARQEGERIVMTNGCFDILHAGHVRYLQQAKALGNRLIVAVNDDLSVRALKGAGRPVNNLADRMAVLSHLAMVDWVVSFSELTPQRLIERVIPDVLVKGGDYRAQDIVGYDTVIRHGGTVQVVDFIADISTSILIDKLKSGAKT